MTKLPTSFVRLSSLCAAAWLLALTGCAMSRVVPVSVNGAALRGGVHGGQQPVTGSLIQLWAAGTSGNGSTATPLLTARVQTDENGSFNITGDYSCPSGDTQVYLTATGGNPGFATQPQSNPAFSGQALTNPALALVAVLGDCSSLATIPGISVNELTTVAAGYALAPFASGVSNVGASATNVVGLRNAMQVAMMLADSSTGAAPGSSLPANAQVETAKLITLADILSDCVNSDGTGPCIILFGDATPSGVTAPIDTFQAALTIAQNPASNVSALFNDASPNGPFAPTLASAPHDWTMSITYTGGGLQNPGDVSVDGNGNLWVADRNGAISGYLPSGVPMWSQGVTGLGLSGTIAIAVDPAGNVWAANPSNGSTGNSSGSVTEITASGNALSSQSGYVAGVDVPVAVALGPDGRAWVVNSGQSNVQVLNTDGSLASPVGGYGGGLLNLPSAIVTTPSNDAWIVNKGSGTLALINVQGLLIKNIHCSVAPDSVALDGAGSVWVGDSSHGTLMLVASNGAFNTPISGLSTPRSPTLDGAGNMFVINAGSSSIASMPRSTITNGTLSSPYLSLGNDALLLNPTASALDASGNLWVTSSQTSTLVRFIGIASPVKTPLIGTPVAP